MWASKPMQEKLIQGDKRAEAASGQVGRSVSCGVCLPGCWWLPLSWTGRAGARGVAVGLRRASVGRELKRFWNDVTR